MMKWLLTFAALLLCLVSTSSWAVNCYKDAIGGVVQDGAAVNAFKIPNNAEIGKKIWESKDFVITVVCDKSEGWSSSAPSENIHAWIKLQEFNDPEMLDHPLFIFGVTYDGTDYEGIGQGIDTKACLDKKNLYYGGSYPTAVCNGNTPQKEVSFQARFRLYVKLNTLPTDKDLVYSFNDVNVLQFDGSGGANTLGNAKNLRYNITGLQNIDFLDCSVNIKIYPENQVVDFGQISSNSIPKKSVSAPFSISVIKDKTAGCTETFDVQTSFYTDDPLYSETQLDMDNGLLMRIKDKTDKQDIKYNNYKLFTTFNPGGAVTVARNYIAELTKHPSKNLVVGPFSKDLIIKINYE